MNIKKKNSISLKKMSTILIPNYFEKKTENVQCNFVKMEDITNKINNFTLKDYTLVKSGFTKFNFGDVIIAKITPCFENGKGALVDLKEGGYGSTEFMVIRPCNEFVKDFIYHVTQSKKLRIEGTPLMIGSGGQRRLPKDFILNYQIPALENKEYFRIGQFLNLLSDRKLKLKNILEKIEIRNNYYADKLLSGELSVENGKITEKNVSKINVKLMDYLEIINGYPFKSNEMKSSGEFPVIKMSNFKDNKVSIKKNTVYTDNLIDKVKILNGDLLIGLSGSVGEYAIFDLEETCLLNQRCIILRKKDNQISEYLKIYIIHKVLEELKNSGEGGVIKNVSSNYFQDIEIKISDNYKEVYEFIIKIDDEKEKVKKLLELEEKRFDWLSDKLLSGEYIIED